MISGPTDSVADLPLLQRTLSTGTSKSSASNRARSKSPGAARDPLGLHVVYYPQNTPHRADIIFIHGLGGTSRSTWSKNRDPELFWPLMFLPKEPDICLARILSFGYNADILKGTKTSVTVLDFAKDLLFDLKYGKDDDKEELEIGKVRYTVFPSIPG